MDSAKMEDLRINEIFHDLLIKGYRLDVRLYTVMINGLCREAFFDEAYGCTPNAVTYEIIIRALFKNDKNNIAVKLLDEMISRGLL